MGIELADGSGIIISRSANEKDRVVMWFDGRFKKGSGNQAYEHIINCFIRLSPNDLLAFRDEIDRFISEEMELVERGRDE